jgi:prepilin peptidase-dependent
MVSSKNKVKGFTLVELLIVIVVIAILAAISIVAYNGVTQKARDDERVATARNLINAAAAYNSEHDKWPAHSDLTSFQTVKLTGAAADSSKVSTTANPDADHNTYKYTVCQTSGKDSGVKVEYYKEIASGTETAGVRSLTTGKC